MVPAIHCYPLAAIKYGDPREMCYAFPHDRCCKQLLQTAEAFYAREKSRLCALYAGTDDMATEPSARDVRDSLGRVHPHVLFQQTSMWEPYAGKTADNARSVAVNSFSRREWRERAVIGAAWYVWHSSNITTTAPSKWP